VFESYSRLMSTGDIIAPPPISNRVKDESCYGGLNMILQYLNGLLELNSTVMLELNIRIYCSIQK
jgi:hypothetical protein